VRLKKVNLALELEWQNIVPLKLFEDNHMSSDVDNDENEYGDNECDEDDETDTSEYEDDDNNSSYSTSLPNTSKNLEQKNSMNLNEFGEWEIHTKVLNYLKVIKT
jgi:hypothetical protein